MLTSIQDTESDGEPDQGLVLRGKGKSDDKGESDGESSEGEEDLVVDGSGLSRK